MLLEKIPKVSMNIINMNGMKYLNNCLSSVMNQTYPNYEVILVDNGSTDGSVEFVRTRFPCVKLIELDAHARVATARNIAMDRSNGKYILTLDNDAVMDPTCTEELVRVAESDENIGSCQAKILKFDNPSIIDHIGFFRSKKGRVTTHLMGYGERDNGQYDKSQEIVCTSSCAALYRQNAVVEVGKWDDDFFYMDEDADLGLRLESLDWRSVYVPNAKVYHVGSGTTGRRRNNLTYYLFIRNYWYLVVKNFGTFHLLIFFAETPWRFFRQILTHLVKREIEQLYACLKGNIDAWKSLTKLFKKRTQTKLLTMQKRSKRS